MTILDEIRDAYGAVGIALDQPVTYGTYYRLRCGRCGRMVGNVGDRLLPGMAAALVRAQADLYATGLLGCTCTTTPASRAPPRRRVRTSGRSGARRTRRAIRCRAWPRR